MRFIFLFTMILFTHTWAQAKGLIIAPETETSSGCDLENVGFTEKESFLLFFPLLLKAAQSNDPSKMAPLIHYPLKVNGIKTYQINTPKEFEQKYKLIFHPKILAILVDQKMDKLFCQYQGIMYGNGEIWVNKKNGKLGITAINP